MERIAARLGDDADDAAVVVAVLRIEVAGEDAKLIDRVEVGHNRGAAVHPLLHVAAVDEEAVRRLTLAADRQIAGIELPRRRHRAGDAGHDDRVGLHRRDRNHARLDGEQIGEAPAVERQRRHRLGRHDLADLRRGGFDVHGRGRDGDRLALPAHLERGVDLQAAVDVHGDAGALQRLEPFEGDGQVVAAHRDVRKRVDALPVGHDGILVAQRRVRERDGGAGNDAAARILDCSGQTAAGLSLCQRNPNEQDDHGQDNTTHRHCSDSSTTVLHVGRGRPAQHSVNHMLTRNAPEVIGF